MISPIKPSLSATLPMNLGKIVLGVKTAKPVDAIKPSKSEEIDVIAFKYVRTVEIITSPSFTILLALEGDFSKVYLVVSLISLCFILIILF